MSTLATEFPRPVNTPDREAPAISEPPGATKFSTSERAPASAKSTGPAEPTGQKGRAGQVIIGHPPSQLLTPSLVLEEGIPRSFPYMAPGRPWNCLSAAARKPAKTMQDGEAPRLDTELPPDAPKGASPVGSIVILMVEVLPGRHPAMALRHWLTPRVYGPVARRADPAIRIKGWAPWTRRPRIPKVLANEPLACVVEATVTVYDEQRVRAACLRMEFLRGRWKIIVLEIT